VDAGFGWFGEWRELEDVMAEADYRAWNVGQRLGSPQQDIGDFARGHALDQQLRSNEGQRANLRRDV
jgi:hypothetical protein